jgi:hypothetical protein
MTAADVFADEKTIAKPTAGANTASGCLWCGTEFKARRAGSRQRFCCPRHRIAFHSAARRWAERAVACGALTVLELRDGGSEAYTPQGCKEGPLPMSGTGSGVRSPPAQQTSFAIQVSQSLVKRMMFRDFLLAFGEQDDPVAVLRALGRLGVKPTVVETGGGKVFSY